MQLLLIFSIALIIAILFSERAERTVLSTSALFLCAGAFAGSELVAWLQITENDPIIGTLAELALFSVLLTDGMKIGIRDLAAGWRQPGRALLLGLPLTLLGTAVVAHWIAGLPWLESLLIGAVLSPTDPVLVSAIIGNEKVPGSLRHLLNVESGLNDGLALPIVIVLIRILKRDQVEFWHFAAEIWAGIALGVAVPWIIIRIERSRFFGASRQYAPLVPFAVGILLFALCSMLHANEYLAAFAAGMMMASVTRDMPKMFHPIGEPVTELLKLAALLVFGALFSWQFLAALSLYDYIFAVLALVIVRPLALLIALIGRPLPRDQFLVAGWFGPKGFASVVYSLLVLRSGLEHSHHIFHVAAVVTGLSILAHSSTDVPVARWLAESQETGSEASPGLGPNANG